MLLFSAFVCHAQIDFTQLDGQVSKEETAQFEKLGQNENSQLSVTSTDQYLKINVTSDTLYVASLCLCLDEKKTRVFHASAALGNVNYTLDSNEKWITNDKFDWKMRERSLDAATNELRKAHLKTYGWVSNTTGMGSRKAVEFIFKKSRSLEKFNG